MIIATAERRETLRQQAAQAVLDLLAEGKHLSEISVGLIAERMGFSKVYVSTRVGLGVALHEAIETGVKRKHPQLLAQLALMKHPRVKGMHKATLQQAFVDSIA